MVLAAAATPLVAYNAGTLGLSFSGAGYLILWYAGVLKVFEQLGIIHPGKTPVGGASSGALTSAAICSGTSADKFYQVVNGLTSNCYKKPSSCAGNMDAEVRKALAGFLPDDAPQRCNGKAFVSVTAYPQPAKPENAVVSTFESRSDLISTLAASSYIPIFSGSALFTGWRGGNAIDGSVTQRQPCPPGVGYCIRVSSVPPGMRTMSANGGAARNAALGEAIRTIQRAVRGERPAAIGKSKPPLPSTADAKADPGRLEDFKAAGYDLAPGLAYKMPFAAEEWNELSTMPCDEATCQYLYKMGQADAMAWARAVGIAGAASAKGSSGKLVRRRV